MLVGSFASTSHGAPRTTQDIDIVIDPSVDALDRFVAGLDRDRLYVSPSAPSPWSAGASSTSAAAVLAVAGDGLDDGYLDEWAGRLGVTELLARARGW